MGFRTHDVERTKAKLEAIASGTHQELDLAAAITLLAEKLGRIEDAIDRQSEVLSMMSETMQSWTAHHASFKDGEAKRHRHGLEIHNFS